MFVRHRNAARFLCITLLIALGIGVYYQSETWNLRDWIVPIHIMLLGLVSAGFLFSDRLARFLLRWMPIGL